MIVRGFFSLNPIYKMFFISSMLSCFLSIYLLFMYVPEIRYGIIVSSVSIILTIIYLRKYASFPSKWRRGEIFLLILVFITGLFLPCQYIATARITYKGKPKDDLLMKTDKFLLGWLIKDGQISLWIDNNDIIGPHTILGKFINNTLQIIYFTYYIIPYITLSFINLLNCGREIIFRYHNNGLKSSSYRKNWNSTLFLFSVYLLNCFFIFFTNLLVPARSPRTYIKNQFKHPLDLSGLGKFLNDKCKDDKSANSFPSGHVAEILSIGLSYMATKDYHLGQIVILLSILIAFATLFLRYHYFCDILMSIILAFLSCFINYYFGYKKYYKSKSNNQNIIIINSLEESKEEINWSEEISKILKD